MSNITEKTKNQKRVIAGKKNAKARWKNHKKTTRVVSARITDDEYKLLKEIGNNSISKAIRKLLSLLND